MQEHETLKLRIQGALRMGRALRLVWQSGPGLALANGGLIVIQSLLPLASLYLIKLIVDAVETALTAPDSGEAFDQIVWLIMLAAAVALLSAFARSMANLITEAQAQIVTDRVQNMLHAKSVAIDLEYYENAEYYDTLHRAQQQAPSRPTRVVNDMLRIAQATISLIAIVGLLLFALHWLLAVILFAAAIPGALVRFWYSDRMYRWQHLRTSTDRRARYYNWLLTSDWHAKEIRLFNLGQLFTRRSKELRKQLRQEKLDIAKTRSAGELAASLGQTLAIFGALAFVAHQTLGGAITLGGLVMYFQAFQRGQSLLQEMSTGLSGLYENNLFLSSLFEFLDLSPKVVEAVNPKPVPQPMQTGIVFEQVTFHYPAGRHNVLEDISFTIRPGEHVAFVGENGAGKTSLIKLLCRLYDPIEGNITFDGIDIREMDTTVLRREISVIFQDYARYQMTARENIWLGDVELPPESERIETAARDAGADEVIAGLRAGYDTQLGKWFDDGEELSIGQWQKVALARGFVRDGQVMVLDEPTSALDAKAECEMFDSFHRMVKGRTVILISHRLSTVKMVDRIFVLKGGKIVESGSHDELVQHKGAYANLFELQAQHYR